MTDAPDRAEARSGAARLLVVIPCLDEEAHLPALLDGLLADAAAGSARIVVVDGGSRDRSAQVVSAYAEKDPRIVLLHNPKRIQSAAVNLAVAEHGASADHLVRVDAHAGYPRDYLAKLVAAAEEAREADAVAVSMRARASSGSCFQVAAAAAQNSALGTGGSAHRATGPRRWVDHGHHALFRMAAFRGAGGYDEAFTHNEDAELDARLVANGSRILLAADIVIDYYPRTTARALARQYFRFGRGRARMLLRHPRRPKLRQLAPLAVAPAAVAAALAPLWPWAAVPAALWLAVCLGYGVLLGVRERRACACASGLAAAVMHLAWSAGFWAHLLERTAGGGSGRVA
jgi:succinoglycan biosynthesis protein ExoA